MSLPSNPAPHYRYALGWAAGVVDQVVAKYPRATDLVCTVYGISRFDLVKYVAKPDPLWVYLRERIKALTRQEARLGKELEYSTIVKWLAELHRTKFACGQGERLDSRLIQLQNTRAGIEGRGGPERSEGPSLPSSSLPPSPPLPSPQLDLFDWRRLNAYGSVLSESEAGGFQGCTPG